MILHTRELSQEIKQTITASGSSSISDVVQINGDVHISAVLPREPFGPNLRERRILLDRVRKIWIENLLEPSTVTLGLIESNFEVRAATDLIQTSHGSKYYSVSSTDVDHPSIFDLSRLIYDSNEFMLILGDAGSGKTTLLLALLANLLAPAQEDQTSPVPMVFNLSSWRRSNYKLQYWLSNELVKLYEVPIPANAIWTRYNYVLPMLDGLDEVPAFDRQSCLDAIYDFRRDHGLLPMIVVSRSDEYSKLLRSPLVHQIARVSPLSSNNIAAIIAAHPNSANLKAAYTEDPALESIINTPLLLTIALTIFKSAPELRLSADMFRYMARDKLYSAYVCRVLNISSELHLRDEPFVKAISWFARKMKEKDILTIDPYMLQPDWLDTRLEVWFVRSGAAILFGITPVLVSFGLLWLCGLAMLALPIGVLLFVAATSTLSGLNVRNYRKLCWSWSRFVSDFTEIFMLRSVIAPSNVTQFVEMMTVSVLDCGIADRPLSDLVDPAGSAKWLQNSLLVFRYSIMTSVVISILVAVYAEAAQAIVAYFDYTWPEYNFGGTFLYTAAVSFAVLITIAIPRSCRLGLGDWFRHTVIRLIVVRSGRLPLRPSKLLPAAVDSKLMYRVGDGYVFLHQTFRDYLASLSS
jgi:energy-coupling factor transporter ATP-binding protein EcfA2